MKKFTKVFAMMMALVMMVLAVGCGEKKYTTVEDWYKDNTKEFAEIEKQLNEGQTDGKMSIYCEGNVIVYKLEMNENLFDGDAETNELIKTTFDSMFEAQKDTYTSLIDSVSEECKIDASKISVRIDVFDSTTTTEAGYSIELTK